MAVKMAGTIELVYPVGSLSELSGSSIGGSPGSASPQKVDTTPPAISKCGISDSPQGKGIRLFASPMENGLTTEAIKDPKVMKQIHVYTRVENVRTFLGQAKL